jgi:hypothetical protein
LFFWIHGGPYGDWQPVEIVLGGVFRLSINPHADRLRANVWGDIAPGRKILDPINGNFSSVLLDGFTQIGDRTLSSKSAESSKICPPGQLVSIFNSTSARRVRCTHSSRRGIINNAEQPRTLVFLAMIFPLH